MTTIKEHKLNLESHLRNPLRDALRKMSDEAILAEYNKWKGKMTKQEDIRYNITLQTMCQARGLVAKSPSIRIL